jgi:hypothetical protein
VPLLEVSIVCAVATEQAALAVAVAVKVTAGKPAAVAVSVLVPVAAPSVQLPTVATPDAFVTCDPPVNVPPPLATANITVIPLTGLPFASRTVTEGGTATAVPVGAVCASPAVFVIAAADPATEVAVNVMGARLPVEAITVFVPTVVPKVQLVTVATPDEFVTAGEPVTEPPPLATKVTETPAIGFPFWSFTRTDGGVVTAVPAVPLRLVAEFSVSVVATGGA